MLSECDNNFEHHSSESFSAHSNGEKDCAVCIDLLYNPIKITPCGHIFCESCVKRLRQTETQRDVPCPLCRQTIESCVHDTELQTKLQLKYPEEMKQRKINAEESPIKSPLPRRMQRFDSLRTLFEKSLLFISTVGYDFMQGD